MGSSKPIFRTADNIVYHFTERSRIWHVETSERGIIPSAYRFFGSIGDGELNRVRASMQGKWKQSHHFVNPRKRHDFLDRLPGVRPGEELPSIPEWTPEQVLEYALAQIRGMTVQPFTAGEYAVGVIDEPGITIRNLSRTPQINVAQINSDLGWFYNNRAGFDIGSFLQRTDAQATHTYKTRIHKTMAPIAEVYQHLSFKQLL